MNHVMCDISTGIAVLTLARPESANAIDLPLARELRSVVREAVSRDDVHAIVLLGQGRHFCAGGDVDAMAREPVEWAEEVAATVHDVVLDLHRTDRVIVAGTRGAVAGAGLSLALVADLVVAAPSTRFVAAWGEIGLTPDGGASWLLPRAVGSHRAAAMILGGRQLYGVEARDWGVVTEVAEDEAVDDRARALAAHVLRSGTRAPGPTSRLLRSSWDVSLETRLEEELQALAAARNESQPALERFHKRRLASRG